MALVLDNNDVRRLLERYRNSGLIPALPRWTDIYTADLLILRPNIMFIRSLTKR